MPITTEQINLLDSFNEFLKVNKWKYIKLTQRHIKESNGKRLTVYFSPKKGIVCTYRIFYSTLLGDNSTAQEYTFQSLEDFVSFQKQALK